MAIQSESIVHTIAEALLDVSRIQIAAVGAKSLPLLLAVCFPARGRRLSALAWIGVVGGITLWLAPAQPDLWAQAVVVLAVLLYYALASASAFFLGRSLHAGFLRKDALFCVLALLFVLGPAPMLARYGQSELLLLGWDLTLSAFSCCVELARARSAISLRQFLFFVLVDPTLSFPERARPMRVPGRVIVARLALGLFLMVLGRHLLEAWMYLSHPSHRPAALSSPALIFVLAAVVAFFVAYWVRAGAAHVRIGLVQVLGMQPPECFKRPYLATSPADFWRRWNCWVGDWVKRYLFVPASLALMRRGPALGLTSAAAAQALAVLASFAGMGLLHDWPIFVHAGTTSFVYLRVFLFAGAGLLVWEAIAARRPHVGASRGRWFAALSTATYVSAMLAIAGRI